MQPLQPRIYVRQKVANPMGWAGSVLKYIKCEYINTGQYSTYNAACRNYIFFFIYFLHQTELQSFCVLSRWQSNFGMSFNFFNAYFIIIFYFGVVVDVYRMVYK